MEYCTLNAGRMNLVDGAQEILVVGRVSDKIQISGVHNQNGNRRLRFKKIKIGILNLSKVFRTDVLFVFPAPGLNIGNQAFHRTVQVDN